MAIAAPPRQTFRWSSPWLIAMMAVIVVIAGAVGAGYGLGLFGFGNQPAPPVATSPSALTPSPAASSAPSPGPSASPTAGPLENLFAVMDADSTLRLVNRQGIRVASVAPPENGRLEYVGAAGSRAVYLDESTGDGRFTLKALHRDGSIETLAGPAHGARYVLSPDGNRWLWSDWTYSESDQQYQSTLHLSTAGGSDRIIAALKDPAHIIAAYRWDAGGAIVSHQAMQIGTISPLGLSGALGDAYLLDLASGALSLLVPESTCHFQARSSDGVVACDVVNADGSYTLLIGSPPNFTIAIPLNRSRFQFLGHISFKPGSAASLLAIAGARITSVPSDGMAGECDTDLVDAVKGDIWRFGPDGLCPPDGGWPWLDDGLIEYAIPGDVTYVVSFDGIAHPITSGTPFGVLTG